MGKEVFFAAAGLDSKGALQAVSNTPDGKLEANAAVRAEIEALGSDVSFGLVVEPLSILAFLAGKPSAAESAPVVLALGRAQPAGDDAGGLWVRLDVANANVQELVRRRGSL